MPHPIEAYDVTRISDTRENPVRSVSKYAREILARESSKEYFSLVAPGKDPLSASVFTQLTASKAR